MKKRIACLILALVMVCGLLSVGATQAKAAGYLTYSESLVNLVKDLEGFSATAYMDGGRWTIGYGTPGYQGQTISVSDADTALRTYLSLYADIVNDFMYNYSVSLNQYQFDALVCFTFNCGDDWATKPGRLHDAIVNGYNGNEFLFAISLWANNNGTPDKNLLARRMSEANLYFNGVYSKNPPSTYTYVIFNPNGGTAGTGGEDKMQGYMTNSTVEIKAANPTKSGDNFLGWYTAAVGGTQVTYLDASTAGKTLYAHWENSGSEPASGDVIATGTVISSGNLFIRSGPSTGYAPVGYASSGARVSIYEIQNVGNARWGRISSGWICLTYVRLDSEPVDPTPVDPSTYTVGTVIGNNVNVRSAPSTGSDIVGKKNYGNEVRVYSQSYNAGAYWGRIDEGYICMNYVQLGTTPVDPTEGQQGTVIAQSGLKVRSGPSLNYSYGRGLPYGASVVVYEIVSNSGLQWGRISQSGSEWVCMTYVKLNGQPTPEPVEGTGTVRTGINVRTGPGTNYERTGFLPAGTRVQIVEHTVVNGVRWGKMSNGLWICLVYVDMDSTPSESGTYRITARSGLFIRNGAGTGYAAVGGLSYLATVQISELVNVSGAQWGKLADGRGWICMTYTEYVGSGSGGGVIWTTTVK